MKTWDEVEKGHTLIVKRLLRKRPFRLLVESVEPFNASSRYAFVTGVRLRLDGSVSTHRTSPGLAPGLRRELIYLDEVSVAAS